MAKNYFSYDTDNFINDEGFANSIIIKEWFRDGIDVQMFGLTTIYKSLLSTYKQTTRQDMSWNKQKERYKVHI